MAESSARSEGNADATLSVDGIAQWGREPLTVEKVGEENVTGRFQAVVNVHDCNLHQIEMALQANVHEVDPHPIRPNEFVSRHPVIIACFDPQTGEPGKPLELDVDQIRGIYSKRFAHVSADPPPDDAAHIDVPGMHVVAEYDSHGDATGRVILGDPE